MGLVVAYSLCLPTPGKCYEANPTPKYSVCLWQWGRVLLSSSWTCTISIIVAHCRSAEFKSLLWGPAVLVLTVSPGDAHSQ